MVFVHVSLSDLSRGYIDGFENAMHTRRSRFQGEDKSPRLGLVVDVVIVQATQHQPTTTHKQILVSVVSSERNEKHVD